MSKERELLQRCLDEFEYKGVACNELCIDINKLLAQPEQTEQEPVAWMYDWTNEIGELIKGVYVGSHKASHLYELENLQPLYLAPPKREPLSDGEITTNTPETIPIGERLAFHAGIRWAEHKHGIGGE